jgi:hypothetical protein
MRRSVERAGAKLIHTAIRADGSLDRGGMQHYKNARANRPLVLYRIGLYRCPLPT